MARQMLGTRATRAGGSQVNLAEFEPGDRVWWECTPPHTGTQPAVVVAIKSSVLESGVEIRTVVRDAESPTKWRTVRHLVQPKTLSQRRWPCPPVDGDA
jgi:hypothetical protein